MGAAFSNIVAENNRNGFSSIETYYKFHILLAKPNVLDSQIDEHKAILNTVTMRDMKAARLAVRVRFFLAQLASSD